MPRLGLELFVLAFGIVSQYPLTMNDLAREAVRASSGQPSTARKAAPEEPGASVLKAICASQFGQGDLARVEVYRNASGTVRVLALRPDVNRFSHAPHTYYGPDGTSLLVVPDRPVTLEELKSDPVLRKQDEILKGLTESGSKFCSPHR